MRTFGMVLLGLFSGIGLLTVAAFVGLLYLAFSIGEMRQPVVAVPDKMMLTLDLDDELVEGGGGPRLEGLNIRSSATLQEAVVAIRKAKDDPRVIAIKANLSSPKVGLAQIQELRDVIAEFRSGGKPAYLFSETIGEGEGALPAYYLASAFSEVWMQPSGTVGIAGIGTEGFFLKDFLTRFGVKGDFIAKGEYKSAPEMFTNTQMSQYNREETEALLKAWYEQMVAGIAEGRKIDAGALRALIDEGPQLAKEALDKNLIDKIAYRDEFDAAMDKQTHDGMDLKRYARARLPGAAAAKKRIAVINAVGEIDRVAANDSPFTDNDGIHADRMVKAIRKAADDATVDAIILRVDSPGGSYVASDTIWREVVRAKTEKKKPVIVSMGDTAASGGYFISMPADRIFASPATVTGSIGVFAGKIVIGDALTKLNINRERVVFGESAGMFSATSEFSPRHRERLGRMMDVTYADFTGKAAQGRGKSVEEIDKVARGRVWSGADALAAGLVDEMGGFLKALDYTKTKLGLAATDRVTLVEYADSRETWLNYLKFFDNSDVPDDIESFFRGVLWLKDIFGHVESRTAGPQLYRAPLTVR